MRVLHQFQLVFARFQFISPEIVLVLIIRVVRSHIVRRECERYGFGSAGLKQRGFSEVEQVHVRFFDSAGRIVGRVIKLYNVFPGNRARIGHFYFYRNFGVRVQIVEARRGYARNFLFKRGVTDAVSERICNNVVIIEYVRSSRKSVVRCGFIPFITVIDVVGIGDAVCSGFAVRPRGIEFLNDRIRFRYNIGKFTGRIHFSA